MSQNLRQSELFAGENWEVLYTAFTEINFNASDPPSINAAMRKYIQDNYPEDFNDWIESSEFVAILDLLSWLGGTLAFKTDLNGHENFLETANARDSIIRLARFLSYMPQRNQCAQGLLKIVEVMSDDDIYDGIGSNLNSQTIKWNDPDNPDWFEQFILVANSSFISTNKFGVPIKKGTVGGINTQLYRLNNALSNMNSSFSTKVNGSSMDFNLVNADFDDGGGIYEQTPDPTSAMHLIYMNDGNGNNSSTTGFFLMFKQGTLLSSTFNVTSPVENMIIDIPTSGINNSDVWVQTLDSAGAIITDWYKVPAIYNQNITYNNYDQSIRNIFSVTTNDNDAISLRFSDGRFGNVPTGNIKAWYRVSNGLQYQIKPTDISRFKVTIPYYNRKGVKKNLTVTYSLQDSVSNSVPRETDDQIKSRAPAVYATQNRMVSGEDYNTFPTQSNLATKIKAVNRVYSGQSRFIDLQDPTGTYQDVNVFADDGILFKERYNIYTEIPIDTNTSAEEIVSNYIQPVLFRQEVIDYARDYIFTTSSISTNLTWTLVTQDGTTSTGYFSGNNTKVVKGATLKFVLAGIEYWAVVASVTGNINDVPLSGSAGAVALSKAIPNGAVLTAIIPEFKNTFSTASYEAIVADVEAKRSRSIFYDINTQVWYTGELTISATDTSGGHNGLKVIDLNYTDGVIWTIVGAGARFCFESVSHVEWFNNKLKANELDDRTPDVIKVLKINEDFHSNGRGFATDINFNIDRVYMNRDGSINPKRVVINFTEDQLDGYYDNPEFYYDLLSTDPHKTYLFWYDDGTNGAVPISDKIVVFETQTDRESGAATLSLYPIGTVAFQLVGTTSSYNETFWIRTSSGWVLDRGTYTFGRGRGNNIAKQWVTTVSSPTTLSTVNQDIYFQWKHFADSETRIDPAKSNIIDMFVLTSEYDYLVKLWIKNGAPIDELPEPPTELDLRIAFSALEQYKMFSDHMIWRPAKYKMLFGNGADDLLKVQFKIVKLQNSTLSDGEIQTQIIRSINDYFDSSLWDFGETFYYTELSAYLHLQLANVISSVVIVPTASDSNFGDGFEVKCMPDEIFISTAQVSDVIIISANTPSVLKIR